MKGIGIQYTAEFWEYDTRLGRRWNLDPKPTYSFSNYSTFAGNPIVYSDYLGDTAVVKWRSGFLGLGKKNESKYVGGQWIDSKTRDPIDISKVDKKSIRGYMNDYQKLNGIESFSNVVNLINTIPNNIFIKKGASSTMFFGGEKYFKKVEIGLTPDIFVRLSTESPSSDIFENKESHHTPSYVIMGHELGHVWDLITSGTDKSSFEVKSNDDPAPSERIAMFWENVLRLEANLPLRLMYDRDVNDLPVMRNQIIFTPTEEGTEVKLRVHTRNLEFIKTRNEE